MGESFLFWAYGLTVGLVFLYIVSIANRQAKLERDITLLKHQLGDK